MKEFVKLSFIALGVFTSGLLVSNAIADEAHVVDVKWTSMGEGQYRFDVSVAHSDEGWDHFANAWDVVGLDGTVYGTRILAHPHVQEQPFTRSATISIPKGVKRVVVRAHDSVHEYGGKVIEVDLINN
ncbi:MAG: hypothetical protein AB8B49_08020 [Nitratireductor sp.]